MHTPMALIDKLYEIGSLKFGDFQLKSGQKSPFYVDLRLIISYPELLETIADMIWSIAHHLRAERVCGVPYTALPIATCLSVKYKMPMIMKRKEAKQHGTKKMIEGIFQPNDKCLIIEDIITSGQSIIETIQVLQEEGLSVSDVIVVIDREQGGKTALEKQGLHVHSLLTISQVVSHLQQTKKLSDSLVDQVFHFIQTHQVVF